MLPSSPLDLIWRTLAPLVQQLEALGRVLEGLSAYFSWCAGCAGGLALLLLSGLVLEETRDGGGGLACQEEAGRTPEPQRPFEAEPLEAEPDG
jgi:hypothetical protein